MRKQLQRITLHSQGLTKAKAFGTGKQAVLNALEHLGYIQIDTISVIERAHHHTLWTRIPTYQSTLLNQLVEEGKAFEYWFHAASYLPMRDFRFALPRMLRFKKGKINFYKDVDAKSMAYVYDKIRLDGPQKAREFKNPKIKSGTWWNWKPAKLALEKLFMQGDLMICNRNGMEKVYDLTERVLPSNINTTAPSPLEFAEYLVKINLQAYGFTTVKQITHLRKGEALRKNVQQVLQAMLEEKSIQQIDFEDVPSIFVQTDLMEQTFKKPLASIRLLSPFDNAIIHRDRITQFFDFDYRLECYVPKAKRQYGYFTLPILFGEKFIGRVDCKTHRKEGLFELVHLHLENIEIDIDSFLIPLVKTVRQFAEFNGCQVIKLSKVDPPELTKLLKHALEG